MIQRRQVGSAGADAVVMLEEMCTEMRSVWALVQEGLQRPIAAMPLLASPSTPCRIRLSRAGSLRYGYISPCSGHGNKRALRGVVMLLAANLHTISVPYCCLQCHSQYFVFGEAVSLHFCNTSHTSSNGSLRLHVVRGSSSFCHPRHSPQGTSVDGFSSHSTHDT